MVATPSRWRSALALVALSSGLLLAAAEPAPPPAPSPADAAAHGPRYTADGQLIRPVGFHTWVFVGSNLGLGYSDEATAMTSAEAARNAPAADGPGDFHNVYLSPEAYQHYVTKKTFPEGTVLVMDKYVAQRKEPQGIVDRGFFDGAFDGFEVAVKNSQRPDGSKTPWAYYSFDLSDGHLPASAPAHADASCYDCHKLHADFDNVWVQFYPVIRDVNPPPPGR